MTKMQREKFIKKTFGDTELWPLIQRLNNLLNDIIQQNEQLLRKLSRIEEKHK